MSHSVSNYAYPSHLERMQASLRYITPLSHLIDVILVPGRAYVSLQLVQGWFVVPLVPAMEVVSQGYF